MAVGGAVEGAAGLLAEQLSYDRTAELYDLTSLTHPPRLYGCMGSNIACIDLEILRMNECLVL